MEIRRILTMDKRSVIQNAKWIITCKIVQAVLQLIVGMLSARYLGPSNYGLISYASSIVAFAIPVMQLGLRSTLVQEFIEAPEREGEIAGTSLVMNLISGVACMIAVGLFVFSTNAGETETLTVCVLYSASLLFQAVEMIQYWFQYKMLSKYPSLVMLGAYIVVSVYKIILLICRKNIYWFVISQSIDYGIIGFSLMIIYFKLGGQRFKVSVRMAKLLLSRSKHYILSGLMITIFANTDHVMLKMMIGEMENGIYTAAISAAGAANFIYAAIIDSARPLILTSKKHNEAEFEKSISGLYSVIMYMGLIQSLCFTVLAKPIIYVLFGAEYEASSEVLKILVWYIAFSYAGTIRNIWILANGQQKYIWRINVSGAAFNVALNYLMIPVWGACGAAAASVLTQFFTNYVIGYVIVPIRRNNALLVRGIMLRDVSMSNIRQVFRKNKTG